MIDPARVAAVLLAAGSSTRFGPSDKLVAELDGRPIIQHAMTPLRHIGFGLRIAVVPSGLAPLCEGFEVVVNDHSGAGQSHSIRLGVRAARQAGAAAVLIALADMPFVQVDHYRRLLARHEQVTASAIGEKVMPPALFSNSLYSRLLRLRGDQGAREIIAKAVLVEATGHELHDVDTFEDLNIQNELRNGDRPL